MLRNLAGLAESDDPGDVERAGAHAALVTPAVHLGREAHARVLAANVQRADSFWTVDLVCGEAEQVDVVLFDVHRDLADRLGRVREEENLALVAQRADLANRVDRADLVAGPEERNHQSVLTHRIAHLLDADTTGVVGFEISHLTTLLLQVLAYVEHSLVLHQACDDVLATSGVHLDGALEDQVDRFGRARGEDDLLGSRTDHARDLLARLGDGFFAGPTERVAAAGGIAVCL